MRDLCCVGETSSRIVQVTDSEVLARSPSFLQKEDPSRVPKLEPMLTTKMYLVVTSIKPSNFEHPNALFLADSGNRLFIACTIFVILHLHGPAGFVINVMT